MRVKAKAKGYYDHEVKMPGEIFFLHGGEAVVEKKDPKNPDAPLKPTRVKITPEGQFSDKWMEKVDKDEPARSHQHGAPKGDNVDVQQFNPSTSDNLKPMEQIIDEHVSDPKKKKALNDVI